MRDNFWGHGVGIIPDARDVLVVKTGMASINFDPNNGYVDTYMLGSGFEMHSMFGDMWSRWGVAGLVLLGTILVLVLRGMIGGVAAGRANGLLLFLASWELWNAFFSPLLSAFPTTLLVLALVLDPRVRPRAVPAPA